MNRRLARSVTSLRSMEGLEVEVELVDSAPVGEAGVAQPGGQAPVGGGRGLFGDDSGQELEVAPLFGFGLFGQAGEALGGPAQLQVAQIRLEGLVDAGGLGHGQAPRPVQPQPP